MEQTEKITTLQHAPAQHLDAVCYLYICCLYKTYMIPSQFLLCPWIYKMNFKILYLK